MRKENLGRNLLIVVFFIIVPLWLFVIRPRIEEYRISMIVPFGEGYLEAVQNEEQRQIYCNTHTYLDDMDVLPTDETCDFHEVGYSLAWNVMMITLNKTFENRIYENIPPDLFDYFNGTGFSNEFFVKTIEPIYQYSHFNDNYDELINQYVSYS